MNKIEREPCRSGPASGGLPCPPGSLGIASGDLPAPRRAVRMRLKPATTVEAAVRDIMRECADQIAGNIDCVWMSNDPEGPHQLRVGLRRLRCIFSLFADITRCGEMNRLNAEARWLAREVGGLRDLDVVQDEIVGAEIERHPDEFPLHALAAAMAIQAVARREALRATLVSPRVQALLLDLTNFIETRGWLMSIDLTRRTQLAMPVRDFADRALEKSWRDVSRCGRQFRTLTVEQRHDLRKELKKLRYAIEFFAGLYRAKRVKPVARRLRRLQDNLGMLNDAQMAGTILESPDLVPPADAPMQRAAGWVRGASQARAEIAGLDAGKQWRKFKGIEPFWW